MKEVEHSGRIAALRCLKEMSRTQDVLTRQSLWRAARRYMTKDRDAARTLEIHPSRPFVAGGVGE